MHECCYRSLTKDGKMVDAVMLSGLKPKGLSSALSLDLPLFTEKI